MALTKSVEQIYSQIRSLEENQEFVSECCGANNPHGDMDICPDCGEHCEFVPAFEDIEEEIKSLKSQICEQCDGDGDVPNTSQNPNADAEMACTHCKGRGTV